MSKKNLFVRAMALSMIILLGLSSLLPIASAETESEELILLPKGSEWTYLDNGSDAGTTWRSPEFNDNEWKKESGPFGYPIEEERPYFGAIATRVNDGEDQKNKYATTYFRTTFHVEDLEELGNSLLVKAGIDDGAVLYLNGHEIVRYNLPEGEIPFDGYGEDYGFDHAPEGLYQSFEIDDAMKYIVQGENTLAVEVHQDRPSSSDLYWDMELVSFTKQPEDPSVYQAEYLAFSPGKNETEYNFSWYTKRTEQPDYIQFAPKNLMQGNEFPHEQAVTVQATTMEASQGYTSHKATITGMKENSEYVYRLGDGENRWTTPYSFTTRNTDSYEFLFMGDPQIGSSKDIEADSKEWNHTLTKAFEKFPNSSFILSAGDQINQSTSEEEYAGYFAPTVLKQLPIATTVGNHDDSVFYRYHFNVPNESTLGSTSAGGNYYFTHGDTLIMVLNTNNPDGEQHRAFVRNAVEAAPDAKWKVVMFHQSIYSAAKHSQSDSIIHLRNQLYPVMDEFNIDIALAGHDHSYVRTHQMLNNEPQVEQHIDELGQVINPTGTLYLTANSSSGSKFYDLKPEHEFYAAVREQVAVPTFTHVKVTPNSFAFTTYRTDTMAVTDTYTIVKEEMDKEPVLDYIQLSANQTIISEDTPEVQLSVQGIDQNGEEYDVSDMDIQYHTDQEGLISISDTGLVHRTEQAQVDTELNVWATVEVANQSFESNKLTVKLQLPKVDEGKQEPEQEEQEPENPENPGEDEEGDHEQDKEEESPVVDTNNNSTKNKGNQPSSNALPNTATPYFTWIFIGFVLIMIALALPVINKMIKAKQEK